MLNCAGNGAGMPRMSLLEIQGRMYHAKTPTRRATGAQGEMRSSVRAMMDDTEVGVKRWEVKEGRGWVEYLYCVVG